MDMEAISLIPTDELLKELARRYDTIVFMGRKHLAPGRWTTKRRYTDDPYTALGVAQNLVNVIHEDIMVNEAPTDGKGT